METTTKINTFEVNILFENIFDNTVCSLENLTNNARYNLL